MAVFTGAGVAIITPFKENAGVDFDKFDELLEEQISGGTDAIIVCGTTGESATMTEAEHVEAIRFVVERVKGRIPVVAGTGSNCTKTAILLSGEAKEAGANALLLVSPYYNKATQKGLIAHFTEIAKTVNLPIILYNIPGRTGIAIQAETVAHLVKNVTNIIGMKEASGDFSHSAHMMNLCDGKLDLYSGNDDQVLPMLSLGGIGVISVMSNIAPRYMHDMVTHYLSGNVKESCRMQLDAMKLCRAIAMEVNPIPVKAAMNMMGKEVGGLRLPLTAMEPQNQDILRQAMKEMGLL